MEAVAFLAAAGAMAVARGFVLGALNRPWFPCGTFAVNVVGSLLAGVVVAHAPASWSTVAGIAALGAFTTYSTFAVEVAALWSDRRVPAALYAVGTPVAAIGAAATGLGT